MRRRFAIALLAVCLSGPAEACRNPCLVPSIQEAYAGASVVFYGEVVKRADRAMFDLLTFKVLKSWKGRPGRRITVSAESHTCDPMGDDARPGDKFLVFAASPRLPYERRTGKAGELVTGFCRGSVRSDPLKPGPADFPELDALAQGR